MGINKVIKLHYSRHTFCTLVDKKEIRPAIIKKIMGHADGDISDTYNHITIEDLVLEVYEKCRQ